MMKTTSTGSFSKVRKLITVLKKCNGKAVIGDSNSLISPFMAKILVYCGVVLLTGALLLGSYFVQPYLAPFISTESLAQVLMLLLLILSFVLSIKDIVTVLYTSDDLELLLPMPFSAGQIVIAKVAVASSFPVILSFILMNSICLGYGIRAKEGASFITGTVLSGILIPVSGISAAVLLVVVVFRVFGFIRNRDITVALGGIFTFALSAAYIFVSSRFNGDETGEKATAAFNTFAAVSGVFPNISYMSSFMFEGSIPGLLISLAVPAILFFLAVTAVKAFYFSTALSIQNTGTGKKAVTKSQLQSGKNALKALTVYEAKSSRRNPAYMIYGFVMSFAWPVLFAMPLLFGNDSFFKGASFPLGPIPTLLAFLSFAMTASCFSCGFNILPGTAFSREGSGFEAIRALPVDLRDYYRSKRNSSMLICSLGSVLYVIIIGIVSIVMGFISVGNGWMIIPGAGVSFLLNLVFVNLMLLGDSKKPRLNWDSETEFSRKLGVVNLIIIGLGVIMLIVFMISVAIMPKLDGTETTKIISIVCAAVALLICVLAAVINNISCRKAAENLAKIE